MKNGVLDAVALMNVLQRVLGMTPGENLEKQS